MLQNLLYNEFSWDEARPQLCALWREAFGDSDAFIDAFMRLFGVQGCVHALSINGRVVAALYSLPYCLQCGEKKLNVAYIYAVATDKNYRGEGIMRSLMSRVHTILRARGYAAALLLPSSPSLAAYYGSMGYEWCAARLKMFFELCDAVPRPLSLQRCNASDGAVFDFIESSLVGRADNILHPRQALELNRLSCELSGGGLFAVVCQRAIVAAAFLSIVDGEPLVLDIFADTPEAEELLLGALCREFSVSSLSLLCCDNKNGAPFAMALPFEESFPATFGVQLMLDK